ncbi:MAG: hypothetical protein K2N67_06445 [Mucispirillum sp.]|nr:hypothetical protein [Mucispirillum sp.]
MDIATILITICINIIIVLGLNLITGVTGQLSLGHSAFMSIGAYVSALLMMLAGVPFWLSVIIAAIAAGVIGLSLIQIRRCRRLLKCTSRW